MKNVWKVARLGTGGGTYANVRVVDGGALQCYGATGTVVAYYGPGMWITAEEVPNEGVR